MIPKFAFIDGIFMQFFFCCLVSHGYRWCLGRFRPSQVNQMVGKVLKETLADKHYSAEEAKQWSKEISQTLLANLKGTSRH